MIFRHISEVKVHVYGQISRQKYEFPAFTGRITHAHTVCTRPFLLLLKGPGYEARDSQAIVSFVYHYTHNAHRLFAFANN